jgi:hypothetical protein
MYLSGIIMCFLLAVVLLFNMLICLADKLEAPQKVTVKNPVVNKKNLPLRSITTIDEEDSSVIKKKTVPLKSISTIDEEDSSVKKKKKIKMKNPLQSIVTQY